MKQQLKNIFRKREKGQSLVEVALFFPIFLIILAGVVEVSHLTITQNRISNAARASTRFASTGGDNDGMWVVALNSVTQTLELNKDVWDIWAIRGTLSDDGTSIIPESWEFTHIYGISNTNEFTSVNELQIQQRVLEELQFDDVGAAGGLRFVGSYILHDVESILGIDALPGLLGFNSTRGFNVMRVLGTNFQETVGCSGFPILVQEGVRSVNPPNQAPNPYPNPNDFHPSSPTPAYSQFFRNVPDVPLEDAQEGYIYKIQNGAGPGNFGWITWNTGINPSASSLNNSMAWPGDSMDYADHGDGGQPAADAYPWVVRGYVNVIDSSDTSMHIGDWIATNNGSALSQVRTTINGHIAAGRTLRVLVWGDEVVGSGNNARYRLTGFAIFRLHGHNLTGGASWILAEFIRWDNSCGQANN